MAFDTIQALRLSFGLQAFESISQNPSFSGCGKGIFGTGNTNGINTKGCVTELEEVTILENLYFYASFLCLETK